MEGPLRRDEVFFHFGGRGGRRKTRRTGPFSKVKRRREMKRGSRGVTAAGTSGEMGETKEVGNRPKFGKESLGEVQEISVSVNKKREDYSLGERGIK